MQKIFLIIGCSFFLSSCAVYKIDIQQGNVVTQEMLDQLELHMPAKKVRFILGSPTLIDVFHSKRWDYTYSFQSGWKNREQRHLTLFFDQEDQLVRIEGDVKVSLRPQPKSSPTEESPPVL